MALLNNASSTYFPVQQQLSSGVVAPVQPKAVPKPLPIQDAINPKLYKVSRAVQLKTGMIAAAIWTSALCIELLKPTLVAGLIFATTLGSAYQMGHYTLVSLFLFTNPIGHSILAGFLGLIILARLAQLAFKYQKASSLSGELQKGLDGVASLQKVQKPSENELRTDLTGKDFTAAEIDEFITKSNKLNTLIMESKPLKDIRLVLSELLCTRIHQTYKNEPNSLSSTYLRDLAFALTEVNGNSTAAAYADTAQIGQVVECTDMATELRKQLAGEVYYKRNNNWQKTEWALFHPRSIYHSYSSSSHGLAYNSSKGNLTYQGFNVGGKPFIWGPCPTGDAIYEHGVLPAYRQRGITEVRFNYQGTSNKAEAQRGNELHRLARENHDVLTVVTIDFNALKNKSESAKLIKPKTPETFISAFKAGVSSWKKTSDLTRYHFGYYLPESALPKEQFDTAFNVSEQIYEALAQNEYWKKLSEKEQKNVLKLSTEGVLSLFVLKHKNPSRVTGACKEDVDRGPAENVTMKVYDSLANDVDQGTNFLKTEGRNLVAGALMRARHTPQSRNPMQSKFDPLINLLSCIDEPTRKAISTILKTNLPK